MINAKDLHLNVNGRLINHGDINISGKLNVIKATKIQNYKNITFGILTSDNGYKLPEYKGESGSVLEGGNLNLRIGSVKFPAGTMKVNDLLNTQFDSAELGALEIKGGNSEPKISGALNNSKNLTFDGSSFKLDVNSLANSAVIKGNNLTIKVNGNATNSGSIFGRKNLSITAPTISNNSGFITSSGTLTLNASSSLNNSGSIVSTGDGTITAGSTYNSNKINSLGKLSLYGAVTNTSELAGRSSISIDGSLTNNGIITSYGSVSISALSLINKNTIEARNDLTISFDGDLINEQSIYAGSIDISANNIINNNRIISVNGMELYATNDVVNKNIIQLLSSGTITIDANNIINKIYGIKVNGKNPEEFSNLITPSMFSKFKQIVKPQSYSPASTREFTGGAWYTLNFTNSWKDFEGKGGRINEILPNAGVPYFETITHGLINADHNTYLMHRSGAIYTYRQQVSGNINGQKASIISNGGINLKARNLIENTGGNVSACQSVGVSGTKLLNKDYANLEFQIKTKTEYFATRHREAKTYFLAGHYIAQEAEFTETKNEIVVPSVIEAGGKITGSLADQVTNGSEHSGGNKTISSSSGSSATGLAASVISSPSEPETLEVAGAISKVIAPMPIEKPSEKAPAPPEEQKPKDSTMTSLGPVELAIKYKKTSKIGKDTMDESDINKLVQDVESKYKDNRAPPVIPSTQSIKSASEYQLPESANQDIEIKQVLESANWSAPPAPGRYYIPATSHVFTELSSYFSTENFAERTNGTYNPKHHNIPQSQQAVHLGDSIKQAKFVLRQHQNMTGLSTIIDGMDYMDQMRTVFERGMEFTKAHKLTPQVEITPELAAQIHEDMVLAQEIEVSGTKVIIPRLYLGDIKRGVKARGMIAREIDLKAGGIVNDSDFIGSRVSLQAGSGGITNTGHGLIQGDQHLHLSTSGDLTNVGAKIRSSGTSNITAQNIYNITEKSTKSSGATTWQETGSTAEISSVSDMLIKTKGDVTSVDAKMLADYLGLSIGGDMYSGSIALDSSSESSNGSTQTKTQSRVYIPTTIQTSKGTTAFVAGDFTMVGSSMRSKGSNKLDIGGNLHVESQIAGDYSQSSTSSKKSDGWGGSKTKTTMNSTAKERIHASQIEAGGKNEITTAGDQQYIGAEIKSSAGTRISARQAKLKALMTEDSTSTVSSYRNSVIQKQRAHGHATSTANSVQISGDVEFDTKDGVNIEYGRIAEEKSKFFGGLTASSGKASADLAARPEWMHKLDGDGQVSFSAVTQQNDSWNEKKQSLTPEAATVVSAGVALGTFALTGGLSSVASGSVLAAAESSAVTAFSATRANQVINAAVSNRGNMVGTVKDSYNSKALGKALKAGVQAGAISSITSAVTQGTGFGSMTDKIGGVEVAKSGASRYIALGQRGLVQGAATSVVTGEKLKKSLEQSMGSAALAMGQTAVGDIAASSGMADGSVTKVAMHAGVGGLYSVANGGKFATGALGGAAGEVLGSNIDANDKAGGAKVQFATTVGGFLAGANAKDMQMAANVAASSFEHNRKLHASELSVLEKLKEDKTPEEQNRLDKAAKHLVKASAGVNENDPQYRGLVAEEVEGARYVAEQKQLQDFAQALHEKSRYARDMELYLAAETKGVMGDTNKYKQRTFDYTPWDENIDDPLSRREEYFGRARGGVQMAGGAVGTVGAYATAAGITAETDGLAAPQAVFLAGLGGASYQYSKDGANKLLGPYSHKEGSAVQNSFKQPDSTTYSGQLVKNTAVDVATAAGIAKVSNLALRGTMAAEQSIAAKSAAKPSASTTPMTSANGNNSPGVVTNNTTVKVNNTAVNQNSNTNVETYTNFAENIWTSPKGTKQTYKVYQRKDIDWDLVRTAGDKRFIGKTNREAATQGVAPQSNDGSILTLHHVGQNSKGPLVEISINTHQKNYSTLHGQFPQKKHPNSPVIHDNNWRTDVRNYWKSRVADNDK